MRKVVDETVEAWAYAIKGAPVRPRDKARKRVERDTEEFLANGGEITVCETSGIDGGDSE